VTFTGRGLVLVLVLDAERWLELRRFRALRQAGASILEIARETGLDWRTVKKYLEAEGPVAPPAPSPRAERGQADDRRVRCGDLCVAARGGAAEGHRDP
jgi:hypothetical protein